MRQSRKQRLTENRQMSLSEYVDDMQKSDDTGGTSVAGNNGNTGSEAVINPEREKISGKILSQTECFTGLIHLNRKRK